MIGSYVRGIVPNTPCFLLSVVQSEVAQNPVVVSESSGADAASSQQVAAFDELGGQTGVYLPFIHSVTSNSNIFC